MMKILSDNMIYILFIGFTIIHYWMLSHYKHQIKSDKYHNKKSNLIYVIYFPLLLYIFYYMTNKNNATNNIILDKSIEEILSANYPNSISI